MASQLLRKWLWQMGLNTALIAAVFAATVFVSKHPPDWLARTSFDETSVNALLWLAAVLVSLPLLIATFRKLQALGLLVAEIKVPDGAAGERTPAVRAVIARAIPLVGVVALGLYILMLSSALLPPVKVLLLLLIVVGLFTWLFWRSFIRIYSRAQVALEQTFAQPPSPRHEPVVAPLPGMLRDANLETLTVAATAPAAGKLIRELRLRTVTGASIVGIERNSASIINPGPDEELQADDQVLLLGNRVQLTAARALFEGAGSSGPNHLVT
jgi:CPA2 family monovalent cation:H+ antiporter-2